jgi:hypothetical protein
MAPHDLLLSAANAVVCTGIVVEVIMRLNVTTRLTLPHIRGQFVALLVGAVASGGGAVLWGRPAGIGEVAMSLTVLIYLSIGMHRWLHGAPPGTSSDWMGLSADIHEDLR